MPSKYHRSRSAVCSARSLRWAYQGAAVPGRIEARNVDERGSGGDPAGVIDEQREIIGPPAGAPKTPWEVNSRHWNQFPVSASLDLGEEKNLSSLWIFDTNGKGDVVISTGRPGQWEEVATYDCAAYLKWAEVPLDVTTRHLRLTRMTPGANFGEIARLRDSGSTIKETTDAPTSESNADGADTTITKRPIDSRKTPESTQGFEKE
jgi:hypothetical protein